MDKLQDWTEVLNRTGVVVPHWRFKAVIPVETVHKTIWLECLKLDVIALRRRVLPVSLGTVDEGDPTAHVTGCQSSHFEDGL